MKSITIEELVKATGGTIVSGTGLGRLTGVTIDSRKAKPDQVFFAIPGEKVDGHQYLLEVAKAGCTCAVISHSDVALEPLKAIEGFTVVKVQDTVKAMQDLARYYLTLLTVKKIAVTGSTGKTSTKEMIYAVLSTKYKTVRNLGNLNNHIGLPLTAFTVEEEHEVVIFEMGMSGFGEIHLMAEIVKPDIAIITNIGISHLERLGTREGILQAKMEVTDYFHPLSWLIINTDNDLLHLAATESEYSLIAVGKENPVRKDLTEFLAIDQINDLGEEGIEFTLLHGQEQETFEIALPGRHNAWNAALAVACGLVLNVPLKQAVLGLANLTATDSRLHIQEKNAKKVIDDSYNASPDSMKAALEVLRGTTGKRKIAILADMFELGQEEERYHLQVGEYAASTGLDLLLAVGVNARFYCDGARPIMGKDRVRHYLDKELMLQELDDLLRPEDTILVKGSHSMEMDQIVRHLLE